MCYFGRLILLRPPYLTYLSSPTVLRRIADVDDLVVEIGVDDRRRHGELFSDVALLTGIGFGKRAGIVFVGHRHMIGGVGHICG